MKTPDIRKIDFKIPIYWTPEQALAVFELIDDLREKILGYYGLCIHDQIAADRQSAGDNHEINEEDLPF